MAAGNIPYLNLAPKLAKGLNVFVQPEHEIVHLKEKFPGNVEDERWMSALADENLWTIVTADVRIGRNPEKSKTNGDVTMRTMQGGGSTVMTGRALLPAP